MPATMINKSLPDIDLLDLKSGASELSRRREYDRQHMRPSQLSRRRRGALTTDATDLSRRRRRRRRSWITKGRFLPLSLSLSLSLSVSLSVSLSLSQIINNRCMRASFWKDHHSQQVRASFWEDHHRQQVRASFREEDHRQRILLVLPPQFNCVAAAVNLDYKLPASWWWWRWCTSVHIVTITRRDHYDGSTSSSVMDQRIHVLRRRRNMMRCSFSWRYQN